MKKITHFVFDLDNTLLETSYFVEKTIKEVVGKDKDLWFAKEIRKVLKLNLPFEEIFNTLFGENGPDVLVKYREIAPSLPYEPTLGSLNLIKTLKQKKIRLGILTNRVRLVEKRLIQANFFPSDFDFIESSPEDGKKPSPKAFDNIFNYLNSENMTYIGDHVHDFMSAKTANINFLAVLNRYSSSKDEFMDLGLEENKIFSCLEHINYWVKNNDNL